MTRITAVLALSLFATPVSAIECMQKSAIYKDQLNGYILRFFPSNEEEYEFHVTFDTGDNELVPGTVTVGGSRKYPEFKGIADKYYFDYFVQNAKGDSIPMPHPSEQAAPRFDFQGVKGPGEGDIFVLVGCDD